MFSRFDLMDGLVPGELIRRLGDQLREERKVLRLSQVKFSALANIPLRTYKRMELGQCDSLDAFFRALIALHSETASSRLSALRLLFPPKPAPDVARTPVAALNRVLRKRRAVSGNPSDDTE